MNPVTEFRQLPGPQGWPIVGNLFQLNQERIHLVLEGWARTYGPLYRLHVFNRNALILSDHQGIMQVLRERPGTFRRSKTIESVMDDMGVTGVVSAEGEHWKRLSRLTMRAFNPAHLRGFFPQVVKVTSRLLQRWRHAASQQHVVDVQGDLMRYALDVTASLAFGSDINTIEGDNEVVSHLNRMFPMIHRRVNTPIPYWRYFKLPGDRSFDRDLRALHLAVEDFIAQARARMRANPELLEHPANLIEALVAARDEANSGFTDEDVFGNVFSTLLAGGDGTANMIAWVVYFLCENPGWQQTLQREVDAALALQSLLSDFAALSGPFPDTEAVIQETMRLKPVFPILLHEANLATTIGSVSVPAGTIIVLLLRLTGLDPKNFPNPERFEPTRWLQSASAGDSGTTMNRLPFTFGSGPRTCPGRLLAIEELKMVITMLVRNFAFERAGESAVEESMKFTMRPTNLHVTLRARTAQ